jgi:hypothetical protein
MLSSQLPYSQARPEREKGIVTPHTACSWLPAASMAAIAKGLATAQWLKE